jgi:hypothetical protein
VEERVVVSVETGWYPRQDVEGAEEHV